jgi:hypothetical protein
MPNISLLQFITNQGIVIFVNTFFNSYLSELLSDSLTAEGCG